MIEYYRNPKNRQLIIWDSETNELFIIERIKEVQMFLEEDLHRPIRDDGERVGRKPSGVAKSFREEFGGEEESEEEESKPTKPKRRKRKSITPIVRQKIKEMAEQGLSGYQIAKELGVSQATAYKYLKTHGK